jgi:branched-chain amino acid aminotransferase
MLDNYGFVAETNACNIFMVRNGKLFTPTADACLPGITRRKVLEIASALAIPFTEKNCSVTEFYNADEVFTSGTMGELTPVNQLDGRKITDKAPMNVFNRIAAEFRRMTEAEGEMIPL